MVCGRSLNCTSPDFLVQGNADIIGYGVISASLLSAIMTIAAVVYAYSSDSMPAESLSEIDYAFILDSKQLNDRMAQSCKSILDWICRTRPLLFVGLCWASIDAFIYRPLLRPLFEPLFRLLCRSLLSKKGHGKLSREQRVAAVTRFILALSDQQLAVGIAMLIAAVSNQCTMLLAEFKVAFALVWFSTTTHLTTLVTLRHYFHQHHIIRNWRVLGMVALLVLFYYSFLIILVANDDWGDVPVQCYIDGGPGNDLIRDAPFSIFLYAPLNTSAWAVLSSLILSGYYGRILQIYGFYTRTMFGEGYLSAQIRFTFARLFHHPPAQLGSATFREWQQLLDEAALEYWSAKHRGLLKRIPAPPKNAFRRLLYRWQLAGNMYRSSLLSLVPSLAFMTTYGLVQLIYYRWFDPSFGDTTTLGFGQITPVFLLTLPILAAAEIYHESVEEQGSSKSSHRPREMEQSTIFVSYYGSTVQSGIPSIDCSSDLSHPNMTDLEKESQLYDSHQPLVKRFWYRETKKITKLHHIAQTRAEYESILREKSVVWRDTQKLLKIETDLELMPLIRWVVFGWFCCAAVSGALLNLPFYFGEIVGVALMYILILFKVTQWFVTVADTSFCLNTYGRLLLEVRAEASQKPEVDGTERLPFHVRFV